MMVINDESFGKWFVDQQNNKGNMIFEVIPACTTNLIALMPKSTKMLSLIRTLLQGYKHRYGNILMALMST